MSVNVSVPPVIDEAGEGNTVTALTAEPGDWLEAAAMVTIAVADFVGSATLVAVIVPRPPVGGAVNTPAVLIVPIEVAQVTPSLAVVPCTAAVN